MTKPTIPAALLAWFDANRREMPWRSDPKPYHVLLSELMLQQTRVETVIPYYRRFLERWPTPEAFAAAEEDEVVAAWAGLGYYSRARNLHRAVREAVSCGGIPSEVAALRALPGVGPYTAGAVASIAFGVQTPVVDGNVERVLTRLAAYVDDPRTAKGKRWLWGRAAELVPEDRPGDFNQALMELGSQVCTPRRPRCAACPVESHCAGKEQAESLPNKPKKKPPTPIRGVCGVLVTERGLLVARRPERGLLAGLWEPPMALVEADVDLPDALVSAWRARLDLEITVGDFLGDIVHVFSHRRLTLSVYAVADSRGEPRAASHYQDVAWIDPTLPPPPEVGLSRLANKAIATRPLHEGFRSGTLGVAAEPSG